METHATGTSTTTDTTTEDGLVGQVRSMVGRLYRRFQSERPEGTLGDAALDVLGWLYKTGPQTLTQLSEIARVAPASMSQSVNRLTAGGYAIRSPDASDRRKVLFSVTAEGAELALAARLQRNAWLDSRLSVLTAEDQKTIARACAILTEVANS
jgi:DNA-binding MarR family transcriptional regulator